MIETRNAKKDAAGVLVKTIKMTSRKDRIRVMTGDGRELASFSLPGTLELRWMVSKDPADWD